MTDADCPELTCGDVGYAKDQNGCDVCTCAVATSKKTPTKTVYQVVADARKGLILYVCIGQK